MQTKQVRSTLSDNTSVCLFTCQYLFVYYVHITCTCISVCLLSIVETGVLNRCTYICAVYMSVSFCILRMHNLYMYICVSVIHCRNRCTEQVRLHIFYNCVIFVIVNKRKS